MRRLVALLAPATTALMTFRAPLVADGYVASSSGDALLLYLPGFDGANLAPFLQWPALQDAGFDVRCASVDEGDRSTFEELTTTAAAYIDKEAKNRPCLLIGESFGGALATVVAQRVSSVEGVVLVNPATSYAASALAAKAPSILKLPAWAYPFGLLTLLPLFLDRHGVRALWDIVTNKRLPCVIESPRQEAYMGRVALSLPDRIASMPRETLEWRLREWLDVGACVDVATLKKPTLVVFGDDDNTLPSEREAARVVSVITNAGGRASQARVPGAGHAATLGSRVDLRADVAAFFGEEPVFSFLADASRRMRADASQEGEASSLFGLYPRAHAPVSVFDYYNAENDARTAAR